MQERTEWRSAEPGPGGSATSVHPQLKNICFEKMSFRILKGTAIVCIICIDDTRKRHQKT